MHRLTRELFTVAFAVNGFRHPLVKEYIYSQDSAVGAGGERLSSHGLCASLKRRDIFELTKKLKIKGKESS